MRRLFGQSAGGKVLPEAHYVSNWASLVGALEGVLRYLGYNMPTSYLMGVTGHAFRIAVTQAPDGLVGPDGPKRADYERALPLYEGTGREVEYLYTTAGRDPAYDRHRQQIIKRIEASIDRGFPVVAYDLHLPEFGVIKGYDRRSRVFFVSTQVSEQYGESLPYQQWPVPGRQEMAQVFLVGREKRADRREAEVRALRFAVQYMEEGEPSLGPAVASGFAGYRRWLDAFEGDGPIAPVGNAFMVQAVQSARIHAAHFLRDIAPDYPPVVAVSMKEAASAYDRTALPFSRLSTLFPYPAGGNVENAGVRRAALSLLQEIVAEESAAVGHLKGALSYL